jgi:uncharacterized protein YjbJ (UPF0337 family)
VTASTADIHCERLFKIAHFQTRLLSSETGQYRPPVLSGHPQFEIRTASEVSWRATVGCGRLQWKPQPFCGFPQDSGGLSAPPRWSRFFLMFDQLFSVVWSGKTWPHHNDKPAFCARERKLALSVSFLKLHLS